MRSGFVFGLADGHGLSPYGDSVNVESQRSEKRGKGDGFHASDSQVSHSHLVFEA